MKRLLKEPKILVVFIVSIFLLIASAILTIYSPKEKYWDYVIMIAGQISATIFFPIMFSIFYDRIKEKEQGEIIWDIFKDFSDGGIIRVYKDRENNENRENAFKDLKNEFANHKQGEIKLIGVSLRIFFNPTGEFYMSILNNCKTSGKKNDISIHALISNYESKEFIDRVEIEHGTTNISESTSVLEVKSTIGSINTLKKKYGESKINLNLYNTAPYCTAVIFPTKCYFSPNILSSQAPVKLPMIIFSKESHGYKKISEYFDYVLKNSIES